MSDEELISSEENGTNEEAENGLNSQVKDI